MAFYTNVTRKHESEIYQAIKDLEARGFTLVFGPQQQMTEGKKFHRIGNQHVFEGNKLYGVWKARMMRP